MRTVRNRLAHPGLEFLLGKNSVIHRQKYKEVFVGRLIRNAAKALIIRDGRMLAVRISDGKDEWYIMPGGGQNAGELLPEAACRESAEELGVRVEVRDLAFVIEGAHGEDFHRVDLVFLCDYIGRIENPDLHEDTNQTGFDWLEISRLNHLPLYPSKLRRQIMALHEGRAHKIYLGNEEIGDPEIDLPNPQDYRAGE